MAWHRCVEWPFREDVFNKPKGLGPGLGEWDASGKSAVHSSNVSNKVLRMKMMFELRQLKRDLKWDCEVTLLLWCLWLNVSLGSVLWCKCHTTYEFPVYGIVL